MYIYIRLNSPSSNSILGLEAHLQALWGCCVETLGRLGPDSAFWAMSSHWAVTLTFTCEYLMLKHVCSPVHTPKAMWHWHHLISPGYFHPTGNSFLQRLCSTGRLQVLLLQEAHHPRGACLWTGKPLNHREEQDLDHTRCAPGRLHRQVGTMLHLNKDEENALWDKGGDAVAVTPADPSRAILPLSQVLHRLVWESTPEMRCSTGWVTRGQWPPQEGSLHWTRVALLLLPVVPATGHKKGTAQKRPGTEATTAPSIWSSFLVKGSQIPPGNWLK